MKHPAVEHLQIQATKSLCLSDLFKSSKKTTYIFFNTILMRIFKNMMLDFCLQGIILILQIERNYL